MESKLWVGSRILFDHLCRLGTAGLCALLGTAAGAEAQDWPRWSGPRGDGVAAVSGLIPKTGAVELRELWRRPVGGGYASISVVGKHAYTTTLSFDVAEVPPRESSGATLRLGTSVVDVGGLEPRPHPASSASQRKAFALAVAVDDGRELWRAPIGPAEGTEKDFGPLSTPAIDAGRVFVLGQTGRLHALAAEDGRELWSRDFQDLGASAPSYGFSTSPWVADDRVLVLVGGREEHNLVAFDAASGEVVWTVDHAELGSYASVVVGELAGQRQIVVPAGDRLYGVDERGELLWTHEGLSYPDRNPLLLPGDRIFMALEWEGVMLALRREGDRHVVEERWRTDRLRDSYSPAVFLDGALYGFARNDLTCLDVETGEIRWTEGLMGGTLILVDGHLVVLGQTSGKLHLVEADPEAFRERAVVQAFEPEQSSIVAPSWGAGRIFLRSQDEMVAVEVGR